MEDGVLMLPLVVVVLALLMSWPGVGKEGMSLPGVLPELSMIETSGRWMLL